MRPREWLAPGAILLGFAMITGVVNFERWGDPLTFADYTHYALSMDADPDRLGRLAAYGTFNIARIPLGLSYYFLPIWVWVRADGHVLFANAQAGLMDAMELPPGSFFLTDPLLLGLAVMGIASCRDLGRAALLLGFACQPLLMLSAISMAHRYRLEFYPFFLLAALSGLNRPGVAPPGSRGLIAGAVLLSVTAAHGMAVLYAHAPWGPGETYLERHGISGAWAPR